MNISEIKLLFKALSEERKLSYYLSGLHGDLVLDLDTKISIEIYIDNDQLNIYFTNSKFEKSNFDFNYQLKNFNIKEFISYTLKNVNDESYQKLLIYMLEDSNNYLSLSHLKLFEGRTRYILFEKDTDPFDYYILNNY